MPQTVRGVLPSERCSSPGSRTSLEARLLPCSSPPQYLRRDARGLILRVCADSHAFAWFAWLCPELGRRFRHALARPPRRPGPRSPGPPRSCGFVYFEALIPPRIRAHDRRLPVDREPMLSWGSAPPEPSSVQSLGPSHDPTSLSARRGASAAPSRGATSRRWVKTLRPHGRVVLVGAQSRGATARPRVPPLGGNPASLALRPRPLVSGLGLDLGGVKDSDSHPSPRDESALLGFLASSTPSRLRASCRPWHSGSLEG